MNPPNPLNLWATEIFRNNAALSFKIEKSLFSGHSKFQKVDIVQTVAHGVSLLLDGIFQLTERDEFIYHEMIAHVPLLVQHDPKRVLVIGGGDGGTVREVLRHQEVKEVVWIEIDEMVVNACRTHFPTVSCSWDDPRLKPRIDDGIKFVKESNDTFDVIIVDSTDPIGPGEPLFNQAFYESASKLLSDDGILITQAESPFYTPDVQRSMLLNQRPFFKTLHLYLYSTLTYIGGLWGFGFASKGLCPLQDFHPERLTNTGITTKYYSEDIHRAAFALPAFVRENLTGAIDPITGISV
jgi:spermidine synthase